MSVERIDATRSSVRGECVHTIGEGQLEVSVVMPCLNEHCGDADDSYDFRDVPRFVGELRKGYDLVQGAWIGSARCVRLEPPRWSAPATG